MRNLRWLSGWGWPGVGAVDQGEAVLRPSLRSETSASHALYRAIETLMTPRTVLLSRSSIRGGNNDDSISDPLRDWLSRSEIVRVAVAEYVMISYSNSTCLP